MMCWLALLLPAVLRKTVWEGKMGLTGLPPRQQAKAIHFGPDQ